MATWCDDCGGTLSERRTCLHALDCMLDMLDRAREMAACPECDAAGGPRRRGDCWADHQSHVVHAEVWDRPAQFWARFGA